MKELNKADEPHIYFLSEHKDSLLEYVNKIALEYRPATKTDENFGYVNPAIGYFVNRYFKGEIKIPKSALEYENKTDLLETIKAFGYDTDKFWYLILFIYDFTSGYCVKGYELEDTTRTVIEKFIRRIFDNYESFDFDEIYSDRFTTFKEPIKITIETKRKHKFVIEDPNAIFYLALASYNNLNNGEINKLLEKKIFHSRWVDGKLDYNYLPSTFQIYYFAKMFHTFFKLVPPIKGRKAKNSYSDVSYNKNIFITDLILFLGLASSKKFSVEGLKSLLNQYKNFSLDRVFNTFYE